MTKTICITSSGGRTIPRYFLRSGVLKKLVAGGVKVIILVLKSEREAYKKEFAGEGIEVVGIPAILPPSWFGKLISFSRSAAHIKITRWMQWVNYSVFGVPYWKVKRNILISYFLGTAPFIAHPVQKIVRFIVLHVFHPLSLKVFFDQYRPDLVFATSAMNDLFDVFVLAEARRRGVKSVAGIRGWDALSNNGFLLAHPDFFVVQSEYVAEAAQKYQFFPKERINVIGFPHYDWYKKSELIKPRGEFLESLGIDPQKRVILFGANGQVSHEREQEFAEIFDDMVKTSKIPSDLVLLYRPYSTYTKGLERLSSLRNVVVDRVRAVGLPTAGNPEIDQQDIIHQINSLHHSEMLVTTSGTIILDAVALGKQVIVLTFDGKMKYLHRYPFYKVHNGLCLDWAEVGKCAGFQKAGSPEEWARFMLEYLDDPSRDAQGRECIRERFIEPFDGKSTERLANVLLFLL